MKGGTSIPRLGLVDITASDYHADLIDDRPSLSKSIIQTLISQSPAHAYEQHPKLNPNFAREDDDKFNVGTTVHSLFLEGVDAVAVCPYDDWRTKAAKEAKADAKASGRIPMLAAQYDECLQMVSAIRRQCDEHPEGPFFTDGTAEKTLVWEDEHGVLCRARLDWLLDDLTELHDLKTTRASANPAGWDRTGISIGAHIQQAFYLRGCEKVFGHRPDWRFVVAECSPPYAMSVVTFAPDALELADKQIGWAMKKWAMCLRNQAWPGYDQRIAHIEAPAWVETQWLEREVMEAA